MESLYYFYNLQPVNNSCLGDPVGPLSKSEAPGYPLEDRVYATVLLATPANVSICSGGGGWASFALPAGLHSINATALPGLQRFRVQRNESIVALETGRCAPIPPTLVPRLLTLFLAAF